MVQKENYTDLHENNCMTFLNLTVIETPLYYECPIFFPPNLQSKP